MTNLEKYNSVFCENLNVTEDQLADLKYQGVELWDSVGHMTLVAALEDAFDIMLDTDDIIDLSIMKLAGLKACPKNACTLVLETADWVSDLDGGNGAVREIIDAMFSIRKMG